MDLQFQQILTHALGFLIVVWLMKKFAWGPLMAMVEERREKIVAEFGEIESQKAGLEKQRGEYQAKMKEIESERRAKIVDGVNEGQKLANELKSNAQGEAKEIIARAKTEAQREIEKAKAQLKEDMVRITMGATEKILNEKLTAEKDRQLVATYIDQLEKV